MVHLDPAEVGRRVRAARGYADGINQTELGEQIGISLSSVKRLEGGGGMQDLKAEELLRRVADATGLPYEFFTVDFAQLEAAAAGERFAGVASALAPDIPEQQLGQLVYAALQEVTEDFAQAAATVLARRLTEAEATAPLGSTAGQVSPGESRDEGAPPHDGLHFDPDHPPDAEAPPEGTRRAS